jgi:hypothetical protein
VRASATALVCGQHALHVSHQAGCCGSLQRHRAYRLCNGHEAHVDNVSMVALQMLQQFAAASVRCGAGAYTARSMRREPQSWICMTVLRSVNAPDSRTFSSRKPSCSGHRGALARGQRGCARAHGHAMYAVQDARGFHAVLARGRKRQFRSPVSNARMGRGNTQWGAVQCNSWPGGNTTECH